MQYAEVRNYMEFESSSPLSCTLPHLEP